MATIAGVGLLAGNAGSVERNAKQRFSMAISGGASKGAYEAGLNWAALKLVRETEDVSNISGGQLRSLDLVSVAGASAGGVNTILSALTWCLLSEESGGLPNRVDDNFFRDLWLRVDINEFLPPTADSDLYLPDDAMFSRKDYFASARELRDNWHKPAYREGCRIPLGVTVTRVRPLRLTVAEIEVKNQRFYIPFELRVKEDGTVAYFFDPRDYPTLSDPAMILMPRQRKDPPFSISDERIIEAAAATSAFPTAFGRRRFEYCRLSVRTDEADSADETEQSDTDLICPEGYELDEAEFADGGLFDNLPVGLARNLAELNREAFDDPFPVTYFFMDPDRVRYDVPEPPDTSACASENPPDACEIMEFSFFSEAGLLTGALGTARKYELYREATSDNWRLNLSQLSYELARILNEKHPDLSCDNKLPYFASKLTCGEATRRAGRFLEIAYDRINPVIAPPYSPERMEKAGVVDRCERSSGGIDSEAVVTCNVDIAGYRNQVADALLAIMELAQIRDQRLRVGISRSRQSMHDDRILRVSSRGAPITGTLLGDFGSFLDFKFREYDYYVGVYDAIAIISLNLCALHYSQEEQPELYTECLQKFGKELYEAVGIASNSRSRYVFARLAEREFSKDGLFEFAYAPLPAADHDMEIIHDALAKALEAGEERDEGDKSVFVTENTFFEYLKAQDFEPTPTEDGAVPLLEEIIADPATWPTELTRRVTARLTYLERQAADLYVEREPNPELREESYTLLMGATAHVLQSMTYTYPTFTFAPSTAPEDWFLRYVIPYDISFDLVEGDITFGWQPTLALSENNLVHVRAGFGFAGGLFNSSASRDRENYLGIGLGYTRRTGSGTLSSVGITPTWYHKWSQPEIGDQDTGGGDVHVGFLRDRLRVGVGTRDIRNFGDNWFLTLGIMDLPGTTYWLTR
jgi:predicted acylesterase/phospholipase RssA